MRMAHSPTWLLEEGAWQVCQRLIQVLGLLSG